MATIKRFEDIVSWQKARELNKMLGNIIDTGTFKSSYKLISQIEGSCGSIMDNIAEGFERSGNREFLQFLYVAKGSCGEFRSQLYRAFDRGYLNQPTFDMLYKHAMEIIVLLQALVEYLEKSALKGTKFRSREKDKPEQQ